VAKENKCIHCGADAGKSPVIFDQKIFCCQGCSQVYQLLNQNKLFQYYNLENNPGIRIENTDFEGKFAFLDNEKVKEKLFDFREGDIAKVRLYIPTIHCASCIWLLEHLYKLHPAIKQSHVNFIHKEVTITFDISQLSLRQLAELLATVHYVPEITLQKKDNTEQIHSDRKLLYQIGVAGFVFGNVMLYSLPEYFNGKPLDESIGLFFYYLGFLLTIPVVFYSGSYYLVSAYKNLKKKIININLPIAIGILALFFVTSFEVLTHSGPGYSDSLSGFLFFLLLGRWYQSRSYQALSFDRDYKSYFPVAVSKLTENGEESVMLEDILPDDVLLIRNKELIPADAKIIEGQALIDYSFVTGEANPIKKEIGDFVYAGGRQTGGAMTIKVEKAVKQSQLTQLWNQAEDKNKRSHSLVPLIDRISIYLTIIIIALAFLGLSYWLLQGNLKLAILSFTSVLIVACPCALSMALPFTFGNAMRVFGNSGLYLKNASVVEKLADINTIIFDKTGTLTKPNQSEIHYQGTPLTELESQCIFSIVRQSTHPLSIALARFLEKAESLPVSGFVEMPGKGLFAMVENLKLKIGSEQFVCENPNGTKTSSSKVYISINEEIKGYFSIHNSYRNGIEKVILNLKKHFSLYLLSGDNDSEREKLKNLFSAENMHFNQSAQDKMDFIANLQKNGSKTLMTGDGLNDAGAFIQSNVSLSVADDIYHFSPAGDAIIEALQIHRLYDFVRFARKSIRIVKINFGISFFYNIIGLSFALSGNLSPVIAAILMPISSITVVAFATFATRLIGKNTIR
jgi:P-type Cu+ transporter